MENITLFACERHLLEPLMTNSLLGLMVGGPCRYIFLTLFIILPFISHWLGFFYAYIQNEMSSLRRL